jgi:hypothetical protein
MPVPTFASSRSCQGERHRWRAVLSEALVGQLGRRHRTCHQTLPSSFRERGGGYDLADARGGRGTRRVCLRAMIRVGECDVRLGDFFFEVLKKEGAGRERNVTFDVQIIEQVLFLLWSKLAARHGRPLGERS